MEKTVLKKIKLQINDQIHRLKDGDITLNLDKGVHIIKVYQYRFNQEKVLWLFYPFIFILANMFKIFYYMIDKSYEYCVLEVEMILEEKTEINILLTSINKNEKKAKANEVTIYYAKSDNQDTLEFDLVNHSRNLKIIKKEVIKTKADIVKWKMANIMMITFAFLIFILIVTLTGLYSVVKEQIVGIFLSLLIALFVIDKFVKNIKKIIKL